MKRILPYWETEDDEMFWEERCVRWLSPGDERCLDVLTDAWELVEDVGLDVSSDTLAGWNVQNRSFVLPEEDVR